MSEYSEKLKDPRWQKKRLEVFERDGWQCYWCGKKEETLHVHHLEYKQGKDPWEYDNDNLLTVCHECHEEELNRKTIEDSLIRTLKLRKFSSSDLTDIAACFYYEISPRPKGITRIKIRHVKTDNVTVHLGISKAKKTE